MSRTYYTAGPLRLNTAQEGVGFVPPAPELQTGASGVIDKTAPNAFSTDGMSWLQLDVLVIGTQTATGTVDILAWQSNLTGPGIGGWVIDSTFTVANTPASQRFKTTINGWCSRWAYARVTVLGTGATGYNLAFSGVTQTT